MIDGYEVVTASNDPAEHLASLLGLPSVGVKIIGADIFGAGSRAAVEIQLSNGEVMTFDHLRDMTQPGLLAAELVACTGATPKLAKPIALKATALVRAIARTHRTMSDNDAAIEWGVSYLQGAEVLDFDQTDRWGAFSALAELEPAGNVPGVANGSTGTARHLVEGAALDRDDATQQRRSLPNRSRVGGGHTINVGDAQRTPRPDGPASYGTDREPQRLRQVGPHAASTTHRCLPVGRDVYGKCERTKTRVTTARAFTTTVARRRIAWFASH